MTRALLPDLASRLARRRRAARGAEQSSSSTAEVQGFTLTLPLHFQHHYVRHDYEPLSRAFLLQHLPAGARALDVGAHIGLYTLLMARAVGSEGHVTAVEPAPENLRYLRANIHANGFEDRVEVVAAAATDRDGDVSFHLTGSSDSHGLHPHPNTATKKIVTVPAVRLDDVLDHVQFVKIDTEGAELSTLAGMTELLSRSGPMAALVEWAPQCQASAGYGTSDLVDFLLGLGFRVSVLDDHALTTRDVADVTADLRSGALSADWYGNLACVRSE